MVSLRPLIPRNASPRRARAVCCHPPVRGCGRSNGSAPRSSRGSTDTRPRRRLRSSRRELKEAEIPHLDVAQRPFRDVEQVLDVEVDHSPSRRSASAYLAARHRAPGPATHAGWFGRRTPAPPAAPPPASTDPHARPAAAEPRSRRHPNAGSSRLRGKDKPVVLRFNGTTWSRGVKGETAQGSSSSSRRTTRWTPSVRCRLSRRMPWAPEPTRRSSSRSSRSTAGTPGNLRPRSFGMVSGRGARASR